jgi:hypothetical protein
MKRNGAWIVELVHPLAAKSGTLTEITINPVNLDQVIRWGRGDISSSLQLMAEMTGQPERLLRQLVYPDVDRVTLAFMNVLPDSVTKGISEGKHPWATADDELELIEPIAEVQLPDQGGDPRFPLATGSAVKRFQTPPQFKAGPPPPQLPQTDSAGFDVTEPDAIKPAGKVA